MPPDESFASDVDDLKNYTAIDSSSCITVDYKFEEKNIAIIMPPNKKFILRSN